MESLRTPETFLRPNRRNLEASIKLIFPVRNLRYQGPFRDQRAQFLDWKPARAWQWSLLCWSRDLLSSDFFQSRCPQGLCQIDSRRRIQNCTIGSYIKLVLIRRWTKSWKTKLHPFSITSNNESQYLQTLLSYFPVDRMRQDREYFRWTYAKEECTWMREANNL